MEIVCANNRKLIETLALIISLIKYIDVAQLSKITVIVIKWSLMCKRYMSQSVTNFLACFLIILLMPGIIIFLFSLEL